MISLRAFGMQRWMRWVVVLLGVGAAFGPAAQAEETYYRYVGRNGRPVYTNIAEQVPVEQREQGRLDLSQIELNTEIGRELDRRFEEEHAALTESDYCANLKRAVDRGVLEQAWQDFGPLLACGGLLLAFLLFTPAALRRFGAPVWAKTLMMAVPALAVGGLLTFTMSHTNKTIAGLKQKVRPCATETFSALKSAPNPILQHARLIEQLKRDIAAIDTARFVVGQGE